jgi:predicted ATPase/Tfp pilus assembly protein PilF
LPAERDTFVGRAQPLNELARRLQSDARLLCLVGMGGSGKTRLALRFGWSWLGDFAGGVWFCDLAQARNPDGIAFAVAKALDVPLGDGDPVAQLATAIVGRGECLLILDNFEQIAGFAEATVGRWLAQCPQARFLVTSREVLGVAGEVVVTLAPLDQADAVDLFKQRAAAALSAFTPTAADDAAIATLVRLLDGLPLAIELAAARISVFTPAALLERMNDRFRLLARRGRGEERQATLRATFDWSWGLLSSAEKSALAQLSVFVGGFSLQAAEAVIDAAPFADVWPPDLVQSLVQKSFVRRLSDRRFDLLLSVQDYASEQLATPGRFPGSGPAALSATQARHWRHFAALDETQAIADRCADADNLVTACERATTAADCAAAADALLGAWAVLALRGPYGAAVPLADSVMRMPGLRPDQFAAAAFVKGSALFMLGRSTEALSRVEAGLAQLERAPDGVNEARLRCVRGEVLTKLARPEEAVRDLQCARSLVARAANPSLECKVLNALFILSVEQGRLAEARAYCEAALAVARAADDQRWIGGALGNAAFLDWSEGHHQQAIDRWNEALLIAQRISDRRWEGNTHCNLGLLLHERGRTAEAEAHLKAALEIARNIGHSRLEATVLCNLGIVAEALGQRDDALNAYQGAVQLARRLGDRRSEGQFCMHLGLFHARGGAFNDARRCLAEAESALLQIGDRLSLGLVHCARAETEHLAGDEPVAREALGQAEQCAATAQADARSELGGRITRLQAALAGPGRLDSPATD